MSDNDHITYQRNLLSLTVNSELFNASASSFHCSLSAETSIAYLQVHLRHSNVLSDTWVRTSCENTHILRENQYVLEAPPNTGEIHLPYACCTGNHFMHSSYLEQHSISDNGNNMPVPRVHSYSKTTSVTSCSSLRSIRHIRSAIKFTKFTKAV